MSFFFSLEISCLIVQKFWDNWVDVDLGPLPVPTSMQVRSPCLLGFWVLAKTGEQDISASRDLETMAQTLWMATFVDVLWIEGMGFSVRTRNRMSVQCLVSRRCDSLHGWMIWTALVQNCSFYFVMMVQIDYIRSTSFFHGLKTPAASHEVMFCSYLILWVEPTRGLLGCASKRSLTHINGEYFHVCIPSDQPCQVKINHGFWMKKSWKNFFDWGNGIVNCHGFPEANCALLGFRSPLGTPDPAEDALGACEHYSSAQMYLGVEPCGGYVVGTPAGWYL